MSYENINLWFARKDNDEIITIDKINQQNKHDKYYCPICGSEVIPKAIKEDAVMTPHFAHIDRSKCDGESMIHFWIKNKLIERGGEFNVKLNSEVKEYICKDIFIEQEYKTEFGSYRPDITILTETGETIYFEVANTNKKKIEEYLDIWIELGNIVVEVGTKDLMNGNSIKEFKALFYEGKCFNLKGKIKTRCENIIEIRKREEKFNEKFKEVNWVFKDVGKYILKKISIELLSEEIDLIDNIEAKKLIIEILDQNNCNNTLLDLKQYKYKKRTTRLDEYFKDKIFTYKYVRKDDYYEVYENEYVFINVYDEDLNIVERDFKCDFKDTFQISEDDTDYKIKRLVHKINKWFNYKIAYEYWTTIAINLDVTGYIQIKFGQRYKDDYIGANRDNKIRYSYKHVFKINILYSFIMDNIIETIYEKVCKNIDSEIYKFHNGKKSSVDNIIYINDDDTDKKIEEEKRKTIRNNDIKNNFIEIANNIVTDKNTNISMDINKYNLTNKINYSFYNTIVKKYKKLTIPNEEHLLDKLTAFEVKYNEFLKSSYIKYNKKQMANNYRSNIIDEGLLAILIYLRTEYKYDSRPKITLLEDEERSMTYKRELDINMNNNYINAVPYYTIPYHIIISSIENIDVFKNYINEVLSKVKSNIEDKIPWTSNMLDEKDRLGEFYDKNFSKCKINISMDIDCNEILKIEVCKYNNKPIKEYRLKEFDKYILDIDSHKKIPKDVFYNELKNKISNDIRNSIYKL